MSFIKDLNKVQEALDSVKTKNKDIIPRLRSTKNPKFDKILYYIGDPKYELNHVFVLEGYSWFPDGDAFMDATKCHGKIPFSAIDNTTRGNFNISKYGDKMVLEKSLQQGKIDHLEIDRNRVWIQLHGYTTWFDADWLFDNDLTKGNYE